MQAHQIRHSRKKTCLTTTPCPHSTRQSKNQTQASIFLCAPSLNTYPGFLDESWVNCPLCDRRALFTTINAHIDQACPSPSVTGQKSRNGQRPSGTRNKGKD